MWYTFWNSLDMWWTRHDYIICLIIGACFLFLIWLWGYIVCRRSAEKEIQYLIDLMNSDVDKDTIKEYAESVGYIKMKEDK